MVKIRSFVFNPFMENTYLVYNSSGECWIIDPGCHTKLEQEALMTFIMDENLKPVKLLNTHCHLDHVFGNAFIHRTYGLAPVIHKGELVLLENAVNVGNMYGVAVDPSPEPVEFLDEGDTLYLGDDSFKVLLTPGHSPASICLYHAGQNILISGDVLFNGSIGRTDLPGGDYDTLMNSINTQLLPLPDNTVVYSGHGPETTIAREKQHNPFLQGF